MESGEQFAQAARDVRIVLVSPSHPGNIGGAARAMKTMAIEQLVLVAPRDYPDPRAVWRAAGARDVLEAARIVETLDEAIGDCDLIIGTSARERRIAHIDGFAEEELPYHPSVRAYKPAVEAGYPILQAAGRHLGSRGVDFVDLTGIFEATTDTLYDDACCHLNREGYARLARRMAGHITSPSTEGDPPSPAAVNSSISPRATRRN